MQLDYAIEGYWLAKRRDFSAHTVSDYQLTFRRFSEFVGKTRELKDIKSDDINRLCIIIESGFSRTSREMANGLESGNLLACLPTPAFTPLSRLR